jgi:hypothetical protein
MEKQRLHDMGTLSGLLFEEVIVILSAVSSTY